VSSEIQKKNIPSHKLCNLFFVNFLSVVSDISLETNMQYRATAILMLWSSKTNNLSGYK
jgi:hypothetical protein